MENSPTELIRPAVTSENIKNILLNFYNFEVLSIKQLNGYDDKNFHVFVKSSENESNVCQHGYVLKIVNTLDSQNIGFFEAQDSLLNYLVQKNVICPRPVKTTHKKWSFLYKLSSGQHIVRLLEYIDGILLCNVTPSTDIFYQCGYFLAKCNNALKDFSHKSLENRDYIWRLDSVPKLKNYLHIIQEPTQYNLLEQIINAFEEKVVPIISNLEKGLIHGDFNEQNVLFEDINGTHKIKGILDFGDCHINCYLFELAITITYIIIYSKDLNAGGYVLAGYSNFKKLTKEEQDVLKICICARICQSLVLGVYSSLKDPGNAYILTTSKAGWQVLTDLFNTPDNELLEKWLTICKSLI